MDSADGPPLLATHIFLGTTGRAGQERRIDVVIQKIVAFVAVPIEEMILDVFIALESIENDLCHDLAVGSCFH